MTHTKRMMPQQDALALYVPGAKHCRTRSKRTFIGLQNLVQFVLVTEKNEGAAKTAATPAATVPSAAC